jgi:calcium permeable stress-gated cation channel
LSIVELKTQSWYFIFQVIQVFLVTTFTSGASAVASQIVQDPTQAPLLLAKNLPKASNFYISYFILQGLMTAALQLLNVVPLLMNVVVGRFDKTPRKQYNRWTTLAGLGWGSTYPKFTNLGVIAVSYSCIAPLVLGFATIGFALIYFGFRYNFLFVFGLPIDMKGENYPKALQQLLTGVYLATICLIGLFAIGTSNSVAGAGPLALMVVFLVILIVVHVFANIALQPLMSHLPIELLAQNEQSVASKMEEGEEEKVWRPTTDSKDHKSNRLAEMAKKYVSSSSAKSQGLLGEVHDDLPSSDRSDLDGAYEQPAFAADDKTFVWLADDHQDVGLARTLLTENRKVGIDGSTDAAWVNEKGKVEWDQENVERVPIREKMKFW